MLEISANDSFKYRLIGDLTRAVSNGLAISRGMTDIIGTLNGTLTEIDVK